MTSIKDLPVELVAKVSESLDFGGLLKLRGVCRGLKVVVEGLKKLDCELKVDSSFPRNTRGVFWAATPCHNSYLFPLGDAASRRGRPLVIDKFEEPGSGLMFWLSRIKVVNIDGNDTHSPEFRVYWGKLLRYMEGNAVSGFKVKILPYIRLGSTLDDFVARINESAIDFQVSLTFADAYNGVNSQHQQKAILGKHFTDVRFRLKDDFFPTDHFVFDKNCKISKLTISNLTLDDTRLSTCSWALCAIPVLFVANVKFELLKLEGLRLQTGGDLSEWRKVLVDELFIRGCVYDAGDGSSNTMYQCMAKKIIIQQQQLDFLYEFKFPFLSELKIQTDPLYNRHRGFPVASTANFQNLRIYSGPIDISTFNPETFSGLTKLQSLELVHSEFHEDLSNFVEPLLYHCPSLKSIKFISTNGRVSNAFQYPDWSEVKELYQYFIPSPIRSYSSPVRHHYYDSDYYHSDYSNYESEYDSDYW
jgi:hypothetical protein